MNSIGFKNFRRFQNMDPIRLGGVNFFVGGNNAGKSTVVKAMLLVANFLKNPGGSFDNPLFSLDIEGNNILHIHNFANALNRNSIKEYKKVIELDFTLGKFSISIHLYDPKDGSSNALIRNIEIKDIKNNILFDLLIARREICISLCDKQRIETSIKDLERVIAEQSEFVHAKNVDEDESIMSFEKVAEANMIRKDAETKLAALQVLLENNNKVSFRMPSNISRGRYLLTSWIGETVIAIHRKLEKLDRIGRITLEASLPSTDVLTECILELNEEIDKVQLEFLSAHSAPQQTLFTKNSENDYVTRSLQAFVDSKIIEGTQEMVLLEAWLKMFGIAKTIQIIPTSSGEGIEIKLDEKPLSEFGRGSIQLVVLFVRLATIMKKYSGKNVIILIEEPEQNLHPDFQSLLAELFFEVTKASDGKVKFIIETHSEYIIRSSQVIAKEEQEKSQDIDINDKLNVVFFDTAKGPYEMIYRKDGKFVNEFGNGFFKEASRLAFEIF